MTTSELSFQECMIVFRHRQHLSHVALARRLDVTPNTIRNWEHGRSNPNRRDLIALAFALNVTPEELGAKIVCTHPAPGQDVA